SRERASHSLKSLELVRGRARPARVLDLLLPRSNLGEIAGKLATRAPEVDLEGERVLPLAVLEDPLQRGIGDEAAVPVVFTLDLDCRKTRRQGAAGHHVDPLKKFP